ncbi:MAG: yedK 1 [Microbacterium sp.]|nr:yedK 1 [Microbacterium sp.]
MCGRFVVANVASELVGVLRVDVENPELPPPSYNIAPTGTAAIVLDSAKTDPPTRRLEPARWGLVPSWAKDPKVGVRAFNARSEELEEKPMFRQALIKRRAVVPATGYYEWKVAGDTKTPHFIHPADGSPMLLDTDAENVGDILDAAHDAAPDVAEALEDHAVSAAVGNVRNDSAVLIEPVPDEG